MDEDNGTAVEPRDGNVTAVNIDVKSDRLAEIPMNAMSYLSDGPSRRLRLARQSPNDIADVDADRRNHPGRPLPSGPSTCPRASKDGCHTAAR